MVAMRLLSWLLVLGSQQISAQLDNSTATTESSILIQTPSTEWTSGDPFTTIYYNIVTEGASTYVTLVPMPPTTTVVTVTSTMQVFPNGSWFVATDTPNAVQTPETFHEIVHNRSLEVDGVPGYTYTSLTQATVANQSTAYTIDLDELNYPALCWYPISVC